MSDNDLALRTLITARNDVAPQLDAEILSQCYAIQKKYQFSEDRTISLSAMERLIDSKVALLNPTAEVRE
jgi:hypothetical protein